jgi:hypothetical protein
MTAEGMWLSRKQRRSFHQPRLRREHYGELIQIDGSEHRWFEDRADPCTLLVFIDDATSKLMQLRFVPSESTDSYFHALRGYLQKIFAITLNARRRRTSSAACRRIKRVTRRCKSSARRTSWIQTFLSMSSVSQTITAWCLIASAGACAKSASAWRSALPEQPS